jgi:putative aldouronate transport system substrate-binding protein
VKYGPLEPGFKDYLTEMNKWYSEGLISPDYLNNVYGYPDNGAVTAGRIGIFAQENNYMQDIYSFTDDTSIVLSAIPNAVLESGQTNDFIAFGDWIGGVSWSISTDCADPELLLNFIDYLFTDEGSLLANYGVEGVSFEYNEAGEPELTELVTNNPEGKAFGLCLILYTSSTPCSIDIKARNNFGYTDAQVKALELWMRNTDSAQAPGSVWETDAQTEYTTIATDLSSFVTTNVLQFITGSRPMSDWDSFVDDVMGSFDIERLKELSDEAVEAYIGA